MSDFCWCVTLNTNSQTSPVVSPVGLKEISGAHRKVRKVCFSGEAAVAGQVRSEQTPASRQKEVRRFSISLSLSRTLSFYHRAANHEQTHDSPLTLLYFKHWWKNTPPSSIPRCLLRDGLSKIKNTRFSVTYHNVWILFRGVGSTLVRINFGFSSAGFLSVWQMLLQLFLFPHYVIFSVCDWWFSSSGRDLWKSRNAAVTHEAFVVGTNQLTARGGLKSVLEGVWRSLFQH